VPIAIPVINPVEDTVPTNVLFEDHVIVLSVAVVGNIVAISCFVLPT